MSPLILHSDDLVLCTTIYILYVAVGIYIWEKDLLHVGNECIQKFHYDWRWKGGSISPIDILLLTFPHSKNATWKKIFFVIFDEMKQQQRQQMVCHVKSLLRQIDSKTETGLRQQISITKIRDRIFFPLVEEVT